MKTYRESLLPCTADQAWEEVQKSALLREVAWPLVTFQPVGAPALPERWEHQTIYQVKCYLFGIIPIGTHTLFMERIDPTTQEIQSRERDWMVPRWDHLIRIQDAGAGQTQYSDEIDIDAGPLTSVVWLFAHCFYAHRQRRWRRVAKRLAHKEGALVE
jgi:hypothetical protein